VQALLWLGKDVVKNDVNIVLNLRNNLPLDVKRDLAKGKNLLPGWMSSVVNSVAGPGS
jgi:hypothetical protein